MTGGQLYQFDDALHRNVVRGISGIKAMECCISGVLQMTLDTIVSNDDEALVKAFLSDPLIRLPRTKARELFDSMLDACRLVY